MLTSAIGWIDFDEAERQRTQRLMEMFREQDSRDELGLGAVRDSIADHLFPGTSTIQTRLRYMLFIPWIFAGLPANRDARAISERARQDQIRLRDALVAGRQELGIIGRDAGAKLKRLPASVYWSGLASWGIRRFPGSIEAYAASLPTRTLPTGKDHADDDHGATPGTQHLWHPRLPAPPGDLLDAASFKLTDEEAGFIVDRLVESHPTSLLTFLATLKDHADADAIWAHPRQAEFPTSVARLVAHAEIFSSAMHGAALVYNLMLSELRRNEEWVEYYEGRLKDWRKGLDARRLKAWSLDEFWIDVRHPGHRVLEPTRRFVAEWVDLVRTTRGLRGDRRQADRIVTERESRLKKAQSRFANRAVRDRWQGASAAERLQFRWPQASRVLGDLARG